MTSKRRTLGRATIRVNGALYDTEPGAEIVPGGGKNTMRPTSHRMFHSQSIIPSRLTCRVPVTAGVSLQELQAMEDAEITFKADTGQTWIMRHACQTADLAATDGPSGGFASLTFEGDPAEEVIRG